MTRVGFCTCSIIFAMDKDLAGPGDAHQSLVFLAGQNTAYQGFHSLGLVAGHLVFRM